MRNHFFLIAILLVAVSCSSVKPIQNTTRRNHINNLPDNVDLNLNDRDGEKSNQTTPIEETVRIGDRGGNVYQAPNEDGTFRSNNRKLKIALNFGPSGYRSISYVSVLKFLEKKNLSPDLITGTGLGAVVGAMYASGMTPEAIEWNFFRYLKDKRSNRLYDKDWLNEIDEKLLTKFKTMNVQDTKRKFFITLYDQISQKTYYFDKGNLRELLLLNLHLSNNPSLSKTGQKYSAAFEKEVFNARLFRQMGAEFTIAIDGLGNKFDFNNSNEFLIGIYSRAAGRIKLERKDFDYSVSLPLETMKLDSLNEGQLFIQKSLEFMNRQSPIFMKKIQLKTESLNNVGNE